MEVCFALLDKYSSEGEYATFFKELGGGSKSQVAPAPSQDDDLSFETKQQVSNLDSAVDCCNPMVV